MLETIAVRSSRSLDLTMASFFEAIRGEKTVAEIMAHHVVHATQVLEKPAGIFGGTAITDDGKEQIRKFPGLGAKR